MDLNDDPPKRAEIWTFKLKEEKDGKILIDVNLVVQTAADSEVIIAGGAKYKRIVSGGATGSIEIDKATGEINQIITWDTSDEYKATAQGPVLRIPPTPPPVRTHMVSKFQFTKRKD